MLKRVYDETPGDGVVSFAAQPLSGVWTIKDCEPLCDARLKPIPGMFFVTVEKPGGYNGKDGVLKSPSVRIITLHTELRADQLPERRMHLAEVPSPGGSFYIEHV